MFNVMYMLDVFVCLQLISSSDSPVTVTPVSSPDAPSLQRLDRRSVSKVSDKNISEYVDWMRCAKEFVGDAECKIAHSGGRRWRKTLPLFQAANARHQPKAKKRLVSTLASEVLPSNATGKCCVYDHYSYIC